MGRSLSKGYKRVSMTVAGIAILITALMPKILGCDVREIISNSDTRKTVVESYVAGESQELHQPIEEDTGKLDILAEQNREPEARVEIIGTYTTKLNSNYNRSTNIKLASKAIDGKILYPGEIFSFNEIVGERTKEKGYKPAIIFSNGRKVKGIGGGICQVSSTLYNAVLEAKLPVIERHPHSLPVDYVPKGKDATVSYSRLDFKFRNDTLFPIKICAKIEGNKLKISIAKIILLPCG